MVHLIRPFVIACFWVPLLTGCGSPPIPSAAVADAVAKHPDRVSGLLDALDLDRPGLETVHRLVSEGDDAGAIAALLEYYRIAETARWLRTGPLVHDPGGYDTDLREQAADVLKDVYTFQGVQGRVRRLNDGSIDWRYQGPRDDFEWALFLNRHFIFVPLIKAHSEAPDQRIAAYLSEFVTDWVTANPLEDVSDEKMMSAAWRPMSAASRMLQSWPQAFFRLQEDPHLTVEARLLMLSSVPEQAYQLRWHHRRHHNHTVKEMAGLAHAALAWPEFRDSDAWLEYAISTLAKELERQVYADGVQKELSSHYHRNVLQYYLYVVEMTRAGGRPAPAWFERRIEEMGEYLARAMRPSGHGILNNDADLDFNRPVVAELAELFDRPDWRHIATSGREGEPPVDGPSIYFPWAGHMISRSGWSERAHWSWFDLGPWGLAHQHNDRLHLSVSPFGRDVLVDTGRYIYEEDDPVRAWIQSSAAHNVVLVDGRGQRPSIAVVDEPLPVLAVIEPGADFAVATFDDGFEGIEGEVEHTRAMAFFKEEGLWVVVDRVETDRPRQVETLWHFHPACSVEVVGNQVATVDEGVGNLRIVPVGGLDWNVDVVSGRERPGIQGWYSRSYGELEPAPVAVYEGSIDGPTTFAWVLSAGDGPVSAAAVEILPACNRSVRFRLTRPGLPAAEISVALNGAVCLRRDGEAPILVEPSRASR